MSEKVINITLYCHEDNVQDLKEVMEKCLDSASQIVTFSSHIEIEEQGEN